MSKLVTLFESRGQAVWLDYIDRNLVVNGGLRELVAEGIRGVTSNPTIFHKAVADSDLYDDSIRDLIQADPEVDAKTLYEWLTIEDVQMAADLLLPVYRASKRQDGYVSLEVAPSLAQDCDGTVRAARHLWNRVDRPNLMIKVPATQAALPAIESLIAEGINVNVTLLFSVARYQEVMDAYLRGLARNPQPESVASVASFFVSRVDSAVDAELEHTGGAQAQRLSGRIAIANARLAYRRFRERFARTDFTQLQRRGARLQRPLWASTGTKNPAYSDVMYIENLIGRDTVNTLPPATLDAFETHGELRDALGQDTGDAEQDLQTLRTLGIDLDTITGRLEREGIDKFAASYDALLALLEEKRFAVSKEYAAG
jgi:transaldolase